MNVFEIATTGTDYICYNLDNIVSVEVDSDFRAVHVKTTDGNIDEWPFKTAEEAREFYAQFVYGMVKAEKRGAKA